MKNSQKIELAHYKFDPWSCELRRTSESEWQQPIKWNEEAKKLGVRYRVFCASLADVFDNEVPAQWRRDLFTLIASTPYIDWLLLTKRIGNAERMMSEMFLTGRNGLKEYIDFRKNIWIGATICNQEEADRDIPKLLAVPAAKRFLSIEPLLGSIDLHMRGNLFEDADGAPYQFVDWVIVGGESGANARQIHPSWVRSLRDQCTSAGVSFFFKQWGKKGAGRLLDGREWDEVPA